MCEKYYNPTLQTKFDTSGNCLSAVIATLFNVDIDSVPIFANDEDDWVFSLNRWLGKNLKRYAILVSLQDKDHIQWFNDSMIITAINSPNPKVDRHAVISKNGRIVFDPMVGSVDIELTNEMEPTYFVIGNVLSQ